MNYNYDASKEMEGTASRFFRLQEELDALKPLLNRVIDELLKSKVSRYPIFVVHQEAGLDIGVPVYASVGSENKWNVHLSTLEEFYKKGIIKPDKIDDFRRIYKNPEDWFTLFVLSNLGAQFIFLPRGNAVKN